MRIGTFWSRLAACGGCADESWPSKRRLGLPRSVPLSITRLRRAQKIREEECLPARADGFEVDGGEAQLVDLGASGWKAVCVEGGLDEVAGAVVAEGEGLLGHGVEVGG